jgi:hypothetical protein
MMLFQWINQLGGHTLIYMTTYDNEVDLDDTYENVMDNTCNVEMHHSLTRHHGSH